MDYTKNYHLPQWVKEDRIMMEDFNAAMASLDTGLGEASRKADTAAQTASAAVTPDSFHGGLFRLAYNHYGLLEQWETLPWQIGVLRQSFAEDTGCSITGFLQRSDRVWMGNGAEQLTLSQVRSSIKQIQSLSPTQKTFIAEFTPPYPGRLTMVQLRGNNSNHDGDRGDCTVRMRNMTAGGVVEEQCRTAFNFSTGSSAGNFQLPVNLVVHGGQKYRLEIELDNLVAKATLSIDSSASCMAFSGVQTASASARCSLQTPETSRGGIVLARYTYAGGAPTLTLSWDGQAFTPHTLRTVTDSMGRTLREAEFRRTTAVSKNSSLTLQAACPVDGDLSLYEIGAVLI